ncbi:uncharacterized protein LOC120908992 isoform X1 [Rana temporaria]|uniref:uncharacterized protein LOC120908992 isoform X1 n=1 Tax=Rana temporaria TaxID=8407 RepID=UPI001AAC486C|nr:uncharacterized protein LOC120908992 isoform X1 [Rana temporaria]
MCSNSTSTYSIYKKVPSFIIQTTEKSPLNFPRRKLNFLADMSGIKGKCVAQKIQCQDPCNPCQNVVVCKDPCNPCQNVVVCKDPCQDPCKPHHPHHPHHHHHGAVHVHQQDPCNPCNPCVVPCCPDPCDPCHGHGHGHFCCDK